MHKPRVPQYGMAFRFWRRCFYVADWDRGGSEPVPVYSTSCPIEAVDPRTLAPGVDGRVTERAWGGPLPWAPRRGHPEVA